MQEKELALTAIYYSTFLCFFSHHCGGKTIRDLIMKLMNCPVCGKRVSAKAPFCPECGFDLKKYLETSDHPEGSTKQPAKRSSNIPAGRRRIWRAAIPAVLILLIAGVCLVLFSRARADREGTPASAASESQADAPAAGPEDAASAAAFPGVYSGDDREILVIRDNGLAYYYCSTAEFSELARPWTQTGDTISIDMAKLHCAITAQYRPDEPDTLIFSSDSLNWNTEVFSRLDVDPDTYIARKITLNNKNADQLPDGRIRYLIDGISFTIPANYRDSEDPLDEMENAGSFVDTDMHKEYVSMLMFFREGPELTAGTPAGMAPEEKAALFAARYLEELSCGPGEEAAVAGKSGTSVTVTGALNRGFAGLAGYTVKGRILCFPSSEPDSDFYILMFYTDNRGFTPEAEYDRILEEAVPASQAAPAS